MLFFLAGLDGAIARSASREQAHPADDVKHVRCAGEREEHIASSRQRERCIRWTLAAGGSST